ncbi:hypothetical protein ISN45_At05g039890 [Arabidopsis thaliana x Arabidopsis arenosa]|uniref:Uncharacterized protein n=2 Tax=Arabidopsis TaxID=3701 RepID=A0A8T2DXH4_ARASU|nr:hypothetical protein ISN45_At05g039890 [Arabidopsis thaliana x Arabidopsis arenosa]KAG7612121.1 hypothetical protein ISN44_As05g041760 [Arabidopsis suecica]
MASKTFGTALCTPNDECVSDEEEDEGTGLTNGLRPRQSSRVRKPNKKYLD